MSGTDSPVSSPPHNGIHHLLNVSQSRATPRAHNINTVKCLLCNNIVSSSSLNSHMVKCHNASSNQLKRSIPIKTSVLNIPSPPKQTFSTANGINGQAVFQSEHKIKFHNYVPESQVVMKSDSITNSPKSSNSSVKVS